MHKCNECSAYGIDELGFSGCLIKNTILTLSNKGSNNSLITITVANLLPENFNSAEAIWALVQELQEA